MAWVASVAVFVAGVTYLITQRSESTNPKSNEEIAEIATMPFPAGVTTLSNPNLKVGDQVMMSVEANTANDVKSISVYDGARRVMTVPADEGLSTTTVRFPVLSVGPHALYTSVTDSIGRETLSAVSQVDVSAAPAPRPPESKDATKPSGAQPDEQTKSAPVTVTVDAEPGETMGSVVGRMSVSEENAELTATDDTGKPLDLDPSDPIPEGAQVVIRVPRDNGASSSKSPVVSTPTVEGTFGTKSGLTVTAKAASSGCSLDLDATGGVGQVTFYEGSSSSAGWTKAGRSTGEQSAQIRNLTPGAHVFMARDSKGTQSPPVAVTAPEPCREGTGWSGAAAIVNGNLIVPAKVAGSRTYLYLRVGTRTFRVPQGQDEYFTSSQTTPIATYLPRLEGDSLALEVWTDKGASAFSAQAHGTLSVPDGETITSIIGEPNGLRLSGRVKGSIAYNPAIVLGDQDRELEFSWTASSTRVTKVMWQVLLGNRSSTDHKLAPGDLIASGTSEMVSGSTAGNTGRFVINTADIPGRNPELGGGGKSVGTGGFVGTQIITPPYVPGEIAKIPEIGFAKAPKTIDVSNVEEPVLALPTHGSNVYVRVVALSDDIEATAASSTFPVTLPTPDGVNGKKVDMVVTDATYDAGRAANPWLSDCVSLTVPWTARYPISQNQSNFGGGFPAPNTSPFAIKQANTMAGAPPGGWTPQSAELSWRYSQSTPICPDRPSSNDDCTGFFDCLAYAIGELYNIVKSLATEVVDLYNTAINTVVNAIVKYSGVCQIIGAASESKDAQSTCKVVMTTVTKAAIGVVLAMAGLPVSLPNPDDIEKALEGDLAKVLVSMANQLGLPCDNLKSADPNDIAAIGNAAGVETSAAQASADPCLALSEAAIGFIKEKVLDDTSAATAAGGPWPNVVDIPGANLIPHPGGQPSAQTFTVTAKVKDDNAQIPEGFNCGVHVGVSTAGWPDEWLTSYFWLESANADKKVWKASIASANYRPRGKATGFSPWNPQLILPEGIVIQAKGDGNATASFDSKNASYFEHPSGGLGINQCTISNPTTRVSPIGAAPK